jgi:hypothetical protein
MIADKLKAKPSYRFRGVLPPALDVLRALPQWITWDYVWDDKKEKWQKPPRSCHTGERSSGTDRRNWGGYDSALATAKRYALAGVGFSLSAHDGLTGIDIDNCRDPESGALSPLASEILALSETYAEFSPSGKGIRLFALGKVSQAWKHDGQGIEIYAQGRYLTVTGEQIPGAPDAVAPAPKTLEKLIALVEAARAQAKPQENSQPRATHRPGSVRAGAARDGDGFFWAVNNIALAQLEAWVPWLFPKARLQTTGAWRVTSAELGRALEEDLSIHPNGIQDFGLEQTRTPIDLLIEHGGAPDALAAALVLCERLGRSPESLGWRGRQEVRRSESPTPPDPEPVRHDAGGGGGGTVDLPPDNTPPDGEDTRPVVRIRAGYLPEAVQRAEDILIAAGPGPIYQRSGELVHVARRPVRRSDGHEETQEAVVNVEQASLLEELAYLARFERYDARGKTWIAIDPPAKLAEAYYGRRAWRIPNLHHLIATPTLRPDGTILSKQGYDDATGLYLTWELRGLSVPDRPTRAQAEDALEILTELFRDFPYADTEDEHRKGLGLSVALAGLIGAILRPTLPSAPLIGVTAPKAGTGKSYLVDLISMVATGRRATCLVSGVKLEEFEKSLGAVLLASLPLLSLDNMVQPVGGQLICMALSQERIDMRVLGVSKTANLPTTTAVFATGNNLKLEGDLSRRALLCKLDARVERPEERSFDTDLLSEARRRRAELVSAALVIARWGSLQRIEHESEGRAFAGFDAWCRRVRDPLLMLGCRDPVAALDEVRAADPFGEKLKVLASAWSTEIREDSVTCKQAVQRAQGGNGDLTDALSSVAGERGGEINARRLGAYLSANEGSIVNGKAFYRDGNYNNAVRWQLKVVKPIT